MIAEIKKTRSAQEYNSPEKSKAYEEEIEDAARDGVAAGL
jgi:hypothetical protein